MENEVEVSQEVLSRLDSLAERLGVTIEYLWGILVKQGTVQGVYGIVGILAASTCFFLVYKLIRSDWEFEGKDWDTKEQLQIAKGVSGLILIIFGVILGLNGYFNPEFYAFKQIQGLIN